MTQDLWETCALLEMQLEAKQGALGYLKWNQALMLRQLNYLLSFSILGQVLCVHGERIFAQISEISFLLCSSLRRHFIDFHWSKTSTCFFPGGSSK